MYKSFIDTKPSWKVIGVMACGKAIAESPLKYPPDFVISEISRLNTSPIALISTIRGKFGSSILLAV